MYYRLMFILSVLCVACSTGRKQTKIIAADGYITTASGLAYKILQNGQGEPAKQGQEVLLFETTSYLNGTVLYSNEHTNSPVKVLLGGNQATAAVDEGITGMRVGEVRLLIAPHYLVKRKSYPPNVSPDSALTIKVILHKIL